MARRRLSQEEIERRALRQGKRSLRRKRRAVRRAKQMARRAGRKRARLEKNIRKAHSLARKKVAQRNRGFASQSRIVAIESAIARRTQAAEGRLKRTEWFIEEVCNTVARTVEQRVKIATEMIRNQIVVNIGRPVTKIVGRSGRIVVRDRSKPGEFPKADTTLLMKTIFSEVLETEPGIWDGFVGTPLDYGVRLELEMNRSFMVRTLHEETPKITRILTGPIK